MSGGFQHRALVTGGARRLGRAMALYLAEQGHDVAIHYNTSREAAEQTASEIRDMGRTAVTLQADLLDETQTEGLVSEAAEALGGPVTCLINNASIFEYDRMGSLTRESWDRHMESNLRAPVVLTQALARDMPPAGEDETGERIARGLVVNMLDQRVRKLTPEFMSYTTAKMGLWAFTQTAARALAPHIRVNAIGPGTTIIGHNQSEAHFLAQRRATILQRGSNPSDITGALGYFLNAPAVTGQLLCVDGGQHLAWKTPDIQTG